ncbi:MAG TPA: PEP/pyruvate-binding domain-containing protein, partial [Blastococcus sp.]
MTTFQPVLRFADVGRDDVARAGGKGASLGELLRAGIRVPDGFVVTTAAFREAMGALADEIGSRVTALDPADADRLATVTAEIRALVESAPPPPAVADAIT